VQSHFRLEVHNENRATVIVLGGELDLASSPLLERELERVGESDAELVLLDLRQLEFMDSTGLSLLIKAHARAQASGRRLGLVQGGPHIQRLLSLTGVADRLPVVASPRELLGGG
jgi:anti-sigma B factor antagonist